MQFSLNPLRSINPVIKAIIIGGMVFLAVLSAALFIAYQQYKYEESKSQEELLRELSHIKERFRGILYEDIAAANSMAVIYKEYGTPKNFDSIAAQLIKYNKHVEMINLAVDGIITNVYPFEENKSVLGIKLFSYSALKKETLRAQEKKEVFFAGPRKLMQGGTGILGKVPIIVNDKLKALCTVLTKMETLRKTLQVDVSSRNKYAYQLIKKTPGSDTEKYFLTAARPSPESHVVSTDIPEGDWELQVSFSAYDASASIPYSTLIMGFMLASLAAVLGYRGSHRPYALKRIISQKTGELAAKEEYFRTLIETSTDAIVLLDQTGKVLYQTPSTKRLSGYTLEETQSLDASQLIHPQHQEMCSAVFQDLLQGPGGRAHIKFKLRHKNGNYIWVEGTYRNLLNEESVKAIVFNYTDITERVVAESKLVATEQKLNERVKELSTIFQVSTILQDNEQETSRAFSKIIAILPAGWKYPEVCEVQIKFDGTSFTSKGFKPSPFKQKAEFQLPDHQTGTIEVIYTEEKPPAFEGPFIKEERALLNTLAEMVQVYLNKKAHQEALSRSEAQFRGAFEFSPIGLALASLEGKFLMVNRALCEMTGYSEPELLALNFQQITHPEDLANDLAKIQDLLEGRVNYYRNEKRYIHKDGSMVWINLNVALIRESHGEPSYFVAQIENITDQKNMQNERQKIFSELIIRNQKMEDFAAIVSHNLRAPLSNILGLSEMLTDGITETAEKFIVKGIKTSAGKLDEVVKEMNQILYYQHTFSEENTTVDLGLVMEEVKEEFKTVIKATKATVACDFTAVKELVSYRSFIHNIFYGLLSNSLKFRQPGKKPIIRIWTKIEPGNIVIYFQDNGIGIDLEKYGGQVFGLNKQFHPKISGKGLGLFMIKAQIESLNGTITVESTLNEGTTFTITLPVS